MVKQRKDFIPASGYDWLLPLYDPVQRWLLREDSLKRPLVDEARIQPGHSVLDIGCGTGTLTVLTARLHPEAQIFGLDPDPKALAIARRKARNAGVRVQLDEGFSYDLPYPNGSVDRVLSSLMFHHLTSDEKIRTLTEVERVLARGGSFHLLDFGRPSSQLGRNLVRLVHWGDRARDNIEGRLPSFMTDTGFTDVQETGRRGIFVGSLSYYRASKAATSALDAV